MAGFQSFFQVFASFCIDEIPTSRIRVNTIGYPFPRGKFRSFCL